MMAKPLVIYNARLVDADTDSPGAVLVSDGKIRAVFLGYFTNSSTAAALAGAVLAEDGNSSAEPELFDAGGLVIEPAFVDMHVHTRWPGFPQKEDLDSCMHAAAAGGFGTVVAMPNTNPVISSMEAALEVERSAAALGLGHLFQSVSITENFGGKSVGHIFSLDRRYVPVITEDGHDVASSSVMLAAMTAAAEKGIIVGCHCEDPELAGLAGPFRRNALELMKSCGLSAWGAADDDITGIPDETLDEIDRLIGCANDFLALAENSATERNIMLAQKAGCRVHIDHISTARAIDSVRAAKSMIYDNEADFLDDESSAAWDAFCDGQPFVPTPKKSGFSVTCEVTPHHIALCGTEEPFIRAFVNPPLRTEEDRLALIEALRDGTIDVISTDHAPHTLDDKAGGAPGFTGLETAFAVCSSVLVQTGQLSLGQLSRLMSANPARILGLNKGLLRSGFDADLVLIDPDEIWTVDSRLFCSRGKATPFDGYALAGRVKGLFIDGREIYRS